MNKTRFPAGWDKKRVERVLAHYESQSGVEAVAEDEAGIEDRGSTLMKVPNGLVPQIRELIANHKKRA